MHRRQYLHQDVKPGNILLTATQFAKLADFGLTVDVNAERDVLEESYVQTVAVGTARYWPPELWGPESKCLVEYLWKAEGNKSPNKQLLTISLPIVLQQRSATRRGRVTCGGWA